MLRRLLASSVVWLAIAAVAATAALGGKLDDFEKNSTKPGKDGGDKRDRPDSSYNDDSDDAAAALLAFYVVAIPAYGALRSWQRVHMDPDREPKKSELPARRAGEAVLPFARVDTAYQVVESDVDAWDLRAELGYGPFAIQGRGTRYDEDEPEDDLDLIQAHAMLRLALFAPLEVDLGIGGVVLDGDETSSGVSGTVPVLFHPWDFAGLEFRPSWGSINDNTISDYDLSLLGGWRFISARVGYRWTVSGGSTLNGPIFGLAARW